MTGDRPLYGPLLCTLGAGLLALAVFLPWYGLSVTPEGLTYVQQVGTEFAQQFGNPRLQGEIGLLHSGLNELAGHQLAAVSAHDALKKISVVLLIIAGVGILLAQLSLILPDAPSSESYGGLIALLGALAAVCTLYRIIHPPLPDNGLVALSMREGAWLALLGSLGMVVGGLLPRRLGARTANEGSVESVWSGLSGWTPEA
jgi:hypothetical protein